MKTSSLVLFFLVSSACGIPSAGDVQDAVNEATIECRDIVFDAIPTIAALAAASCSQLQSDIEESRQAVVDAVLQGFGCSVEESNGAARWNCSAACQWGR